MRHPRAEARAAITLLLAGRSMHPCTSFLSPTLVSRSSATMATRCFTLLHSRSCSVSCMPPYPTQQHPNPAKRLLLLLLPHQRASFWSKAVGCDGRGGNPLAISASMSTRRLGVLSAGRVAKDTSDGDRGASEGRDSIQGAAPQSRSGIKRPTGIRRLGVTGGRVGGVSGGGRASWDGGRGQASGGRGAVPYGGGRGRGGSARGMHDSSGRPKPSQFGGNIPEDKLHITFTRSSGSGGQNVNKVSTRVEVRFVVEEADWLPHDVRTRLARHQSGRVNKDGELVVTSQEFRTQTQNRSTALKKLKEMIEEAWNPPKERQMRTGISKRGKAMRRADKEFRSKVKANRGKVKDYD